MDRLRVTAVLLLICAGFVVAEEDLTEDEDDEYVYYTDYHMVVITPLESTDKLDVLNDLRDKYERIIGKEFRNKALVFFDDILITNRPLFFILGPSIQDEVYKTLTDSEIEYRTEKEDLQKTFDWNWDRNNFQKTRYKDTLAQDIYMAPFYYMSYSEASEFLKFLAGDINERLGPVASTFSIGKSSEGTDIMGFAVNENRKELPGIWIDGGLDGRNVLAQALSIFLMWELLFKNEEESMFLRENFRWYFVPNTNPDGYKYNEEMDRMWQKNTNGIHIGSNKCFGVNLMKNFNVNFGGADSSDDPCSEQYRGPEPLSEPETQALAKALQDRKGLIQLYINLGSFGHSWNVPWSGDVTDKPENFDYQYHLGTIAVNTITSIASSAPQLGTHSQLSYARSGHVLDYAHQEVGIPYTYSIDLRPEIAEIPMESNYFDVPPTFIHLTGPEIFAAISSMSQELLKGVVLPPEGVKSDKEEL